MPPKRHDDLFDAIASFPALRAAAKRAIRGKRGKAMPAAFMAGLEREILTLERELQTGTYRPGGYVEIRVEDPKPRMVSAAPFRDRVVHHALCAVIEPIFDRGFIFDSYANRVAKGTHAAVARYERFRDRSAHVLRCDIYRYFPSIDHAILKADLRRRIACERTLWLIDAIIDGSNPQEPVHIHYPGDDLFTPFERRRGLPLGNLTSQFFANLYLDGLDHFCTEVLPTQGYLRYVDDFALFADDPEVLGECRRWIGDFLTGRRLKLHPRKTVIRPSAEPAAFLGYVLAPGRRWLPEDNVRRFRNRWRGLRDRVRAGTLPEDDAARRVCSWIAHAEHAQTWRLRHAIFRGGPFDPACADDLPRWPLGPQAGAWPAPSRNRVNRGGSWNNNPRNLRSANRNRNEPDNRNNTLGFRLARTPLNSQSRRVHGRTG
ncbi:MAG: reverse transcriptase domain-containing protein [Defluviicoccus sp.]